MENNTMSLLPCPLCCLPKFQDVDVLRMTLIKVATAELFCPVCNESMMGLDKLTIHLFVHANNAPNTIWNEYTNNVAKEKPHVQVEDFPIANDSSDLRKTQYSQEVVPSTKETTEISCDICDFTFTDPIILELHQKLLHHGNSEKSAVTSSYHCHLCSKVFKMKGSLVVHLRVAHFGFTADKNDGKFLHNNKIAIGMPALKMDNKQWECDVCSKMFTTKYFLKKHKRLHTGEMPYSCHQCNKSFTFQQSYRKHMLYHSSEKPHTCNECGRSFKELSTLQNHVRIHSGERPFACETCGKRFRQRVSYLVHRRIHTGVMPYECKQCAKKFRYKVSQRSHKCIPETCSLGGNVNEVKLVINSSSLNRSNTDQTDSDVQCLLTMDHEGKISLIKKDNTTNNDAMKPNFLPQYPNSESNLHQENNDNAFSTDLYSMMMSPLLPEVESLNLSGPPPVHNIETESRNQDSCAFTQKFFTENSLYNVNSL